MTISKIDWILLALRVKPLNGRRLDATLFCIWNKLGKDIPEYFSFEASTYGPQITDLYGSIGELSRRELIILPEHFGRDENRFSLTDKGKIEAENIAAQADKDILILIEQVTCEISVMKPFQMLQKMQSEAPGFINPSLVESKIREKAMQILLSGRSGKLQEIEKLLGIEANTTMPEIAAKLAMTEYQLKYRLNRDWNRQQTKEKKAEEGKVKAMDGATIFCQLLKFSIWLPKYWQFEVENNEVEDLSESFKWRYEEWQKSCASLNMKELYESIRFDGYLYEYVTFDVPWDGRDGSTWFFPREEVNGNVLPFELFMQRMNETKEEKDSLWQEKLSMKLKQGWQVGYFSASPKNGDGESELQVEVTKFSFREPLSSLELYYAEKPEKENISQIPTRRDKKWTIDGMAAIKAYYIWNIGGEEPCQFSSYLADGSDGWAIDCWSPKEKRHILRPLFHKIISSFRRI